MEFSELFETKLKIKYMRLLVLCDSSKVWLYDKVGNNLSNTNPLSNKLVIVGLYQLARPIFITQWQYY